MPLIEEVSSTSSSKSSSSAKGSNPKKTKSKSKKSKQPSLSPHTQSSLPPGVMESLMSMNFGDVPADADTSNPFLQSLGSINKAAGSAGLGPPGGPDAKASPEQMKVAFDMLSNLEKTDPAAFDEIMTKLETDMRQRAEEKGIDLEEAQRKADEFIKNNPGTPFPGAPAQGGGLGDDVKLPDGRKMSKDGIKSEGEQEGVLITPNPVFSLKTVDGVTGNKVFINVCTHEKVTEPRTVKRLNEKGEEVEGLSVPVAVSSVRRGGKGGPDSITFDCVVNEFVITEIGKDASGGYRDFICQLVMQYVEQKSAKKVEDGGLGEGNELRIDKRYKLPKLKYHAYVDEAGKVVDPDDLKDALKSKKAGCAKQWVREAGKGEKGISEVDTDRKKAKPKQHKKEVKKPPMSNRKVGISLGVETSDGTEVPLLEHAAELGEECEMSDLPKPNPDGITESQLLMTPFLRDAAADVSAVVISIPLRRDSGPNAQVDLSAFQLTVEPPGFIRTTAVLPYPVLWKKAKAEYDKGGEVLRVRAEVMRCDMDAEADVGSRAWGLAQALGGGAGEGEGRAAKKESVAAGGGGDRDAGDDDGSMPEDRFHLNMPKGYNQYSGEFQEEDREDDGNDTGELPEDRFHKNDIISQHILEQQAAERQKKIDKAEEDRLERKRKKEAGTKDDDIEYLDVDDFKPGGKYFSGKTGSVVDEPDNENARMLFNNKDLVKAATVMKGGDEGDGAGAVKGKVELSSNLWTELLD
mmetsp:Transcript_19776/g.41093  ORF Transcript_19776/g.41093 Transcript_19776/m.41093 type:complete len:747 (-) Transcript_19776:64-2304(-)|eukprot:CAMPEP_0197550258 /NCGR_PEP_ID=MMETSP1320-20131121/3912_1 /TAXON_ID=91990 /ORGANISM="Bolidomonas sp., Strain RCC2347" /LENGTH=746 /DNA_ID=CAMNT_0043110605 /DNA_START=110 /DNA_END=2350 /DNA_ORIENTATION=-